MVTTRLLPLLAALTGVIVWRSWRVVKNTIIQVPHFPVGYYSEGDFGTNCSTIRVPDFKYCEDAIFWDHLDEQGNFVDRTLLLSCDGGRKAWNTVLGPMKDPNPHGSLWIYELDNQISKDVKLDSSRLRRLELRGYPVGHDFHPLGLEAYPSYAGNSSNLYVVNHARAQTLIEQFTLSPSEPNVATYIRTLSSFHFISANAISLTSPDSFYVTNDHLITLRLPYIGPVLSFLESLLALPLSFISHVTLSPPNTSKSPIQSAKFSVLFMPFPNGMALSRKGTHVAISSSTLAEVYIYSRNPATNALKQIAAVPVPFVPDNLFYTHDNSILTVAGHPSFIGLTDVAASKGEIAPSWVLSISLNGTDAPPVVDFDTQAPTSAKGMVPAVAGYELKTLFQSDGSGFTASTTGLIDPITGVLFVSGVYDEVGLMMCNPKST